MGKIAAWYRRLRGEGPLVRIGLAIGGTLALALAIAAAVTIIGLNLLHFRGFKPEPLLSAGTLYDLLKVAFAVAAGIGGVIALVTAYRRQRYIEIAEHRASREEQLAARAEERAARDSELERELASTRLLNERFATAAAQLGDDKPAAVRLAGVYAMAGLADDWPQQRQTCVDVLCAYLRMPYEPDPGDDAPPAQRQAFRALREVRHTVIRVITAHLQAGGHRAATAQDWRGLGLDLADVVFDGGSFNGAEFSGRTSFTGAEFSGLVTFDGAEFSGGTVTFTVAEFSDGLVSFGGARFSGARVRFDHAEFSGGGVSFDGAEFSGGEIDFGSARFSGGTVGFYGARFSGARVGFTVAEFSDGLVSFDDAQFGRGWVRFDHARFSGARVSFDGACFSGGLVDFGDARFSGGTIDFQQPGDWSVPPKMPSWEHPTRGVLLPTDQPQR
jgi:uncharacterized protein YjbI with pentapeptide repeats